MSPSKKNRSEVTGDFACVLRVCILHVLNIVFVFQIHFTRMRDSASTPLAADRQISLLWRKCRPALFASDHEARVLGWLIDFPWASFNLMLESAKPEKNRRHCMSGVPNARSSMSGAIMNKTGKDD